MNLQNFKSAFAAQILKRGKEYYEDNHIENVTQINATNWQAEVHGSELYIVDIIIDDAFEIRYMDCDCPYEENCKHLAAVLYFMKDEYFPKKQVKPKSKAVPSMNKLLQQQSKEQLIELILTLSHKHSAFKKELELQLTPKENELEAAYKMIVHYAEAAQDRSGFIRYGQVAKAIKGIDLVHERIETHIKQGHIQLAVQLALLCVYQGMEIMECGDDSSGELGGAVESSIGLLNQAIANGEQWLDEGQRRDVLDQVGDAIDHDALQDWSDWQLDLLHSCLPLCKDPFCENQFSLLLNQLAQKHSEGWAGTYAQGRVQRMKQQLETIKLNDEQALVYLRHHPEDDELRERLIDRALLRHDYVLVLELGEQGNELKKSNRNWKEYLFLAHKALQHKQEMRVLGEQLLLEGDGAYYAIVKAMYDNREWSLKREQLLDQLKQKNRYLYGLFIVEEKLTARILDFCQKNSYVIGDYYMHLIGIYDKEAEAIFVEEISENAESANNRSQYSRVCKLITVMQKAGYLERAAALIDTLKQQNKRRSAFVDELNKIS